MVITTIRTTPILAADAVAAADINAIGYPNMNKPSDALIDAQLEEQPYRMITKCDFMLL